MAGGCKIWLAYQESISGELYRMISEGHPCEIQGVTMVVHRTDAGKKSKWRVSDPFTGRRAGDFIGGTKKMVIDKVRNYVKQMEQKADKPFIEIIEGLRKEAGNVMSLSEGKPDGTTKSMPT